jgi:RNA polymerase sigma-70 factor (ECF subfamily)
LLHPELDDVQLMMALGAEEPGALEDLYDRYGTFVFSLAYQLVGNRESAEEIVQESFLTVWRYAGRYQAGLSPVRPWLMRMVRQRSIDHLRGRAARPLLGAPLSDDQPSPCDVWQDVSQGMLQEEVHAAVSCLPPEQRAAIELAYFSGCTHAEIAEQLDVPLGTVKGRLRLGLKKLQALLTPTLA